MIEVDVPQLSPEWFDLHLGVISGSKFSALVTPKGNPSSQWKKLAYLMAAEVFLGRKEETFSNYHTRRGQALEPEARDVYEILTGNPVRETGFLFLDDTMRCGISPDGLIQTKYVSLQRWAVEYPDNKGLEIKCPTLGVHTQYLIEDICPEEYIPQIQGSMYVTGFDEWDFISYYPGMPPYIITVQRDDHFITVLEDQLGAWYEELQMFIDILKEMEDEN